MPTGDGHILDADLIDAADAVHDLPAAAMASVPAAPAEAAVPIAIEDLLPDASGEVVLSATEGLTIALSARATPIDTGVADHHVTASGLDVSGFGYYSFAGGLTVYFPHHSLVTVSLEEMT